MYILKLKDKGTSTPKEPTKDTPKNQRSKPQLTRGRSPHLKAPRKTPRENKNTEV